MIRSILSLTELLYMIYQYKMVEYLSVKHSESQTLVRGPMQRKIERIAALCFVMLFWDITIIYCCYLGQSSGVLSSSLESDYQNARSVKRKSHTKYTFRKHSTGVPRLRLDVTQGWGRAVGHLYFILIEHIY